MIRRALFLATLSAAALLTAGPSLADTISLGQLDLSHVSQDWGDPQKDQSVDKNALKIAGESFKSGLGTHAMSTLRIAVNGATRFTAKVGVDDEKTSEDGPSAASVEFIVLGDNKVLFNSGVMKKGTPAKAIDLDLTGIKELTLRVTDGGDDNTGDHADWADAMFLLPAGAAAPVALGAPPPPPAVRLTPEPKPTPRINGARVFGARPGSPIVIKIPVTGEKPITYSIDALPPGLSLDSTTGILTGAIDKAGEYKLNVAAKNAKGEATRAWTIRISDEPGTLSLTPPMGWNSWNVWGMAIDDGKVRAAADAFVSSGLIDHGWTFINIDDGWAVRPGTKDANFSNDAGKARDEKGNVLPNRKFPDMKGLADYVHAKGLKIGLYSSPGTLTCGGVEGSYGFEAEDAKTYADWGFDYLKHDWCSYGNPYELIKRKQHATLDTRKEHIAPYALMRDELRKQKRDIVYSLCQYGMERVWEWGDQVDAQCWRTTGDITDTWRSMSGIGFSQNGHEKFAKPGRWNDPDMLVVGHVGWGPNVRATRLTPDELYTHVSLWSLLSSPLLIGCDLTKLDSFTLGLLTNDEVIDINQDPLGKQAARVSKQGELEVWSRPLEDGGVAVGLFNRGDAPDTVEAKWTDLGLPADATRDVRNVWKQESLGTSTGSFKAEVAPHGVVLIKIAGK